MTEVTRAGDERRMRVASKASRVASRAGVAPPDARSAKELWRRRLERAIFVLLLALLFVVAVPYGSVDPWWEGFFEACAFALGALWMIEGMLGGAWLVAEHRLLAALAALAAFACAQAISLPGGATVAGLRVSRTISADPFETWRFAVKLAALLLAAALMLRYTSSLRRLRALAFAVVGVGFASAVFGIFRQMASGETLSFVSPRLAENVGGYAQFINRNHFAYLAEMTLGLLLGLLVAERSRRERWPAYAALTLAVWAALVMSNSRAGLLAMFAQIAFAALLYFSFVARGVVRRPENNLDEGDDRRHRANSRLHVRARSSLLLLRAALVAALLAFVFVGVVWVGGEPLASRLGALPGDVGAASGVRWGDRRAEVWRATLGLIEDHPLAGVGFGAFRAAVTARHDASGEMSLEQAHDDYLELLASGGIVGAALFAWFAVLFARRALATLRSPERFRQAATLGALSGVAAVAVHSLFDFGLHVTADALVFAALAAIAVAGVRTERRDRQLDPTPRRAPVWMNGVRHKSSYVLAVVCLVSCCGAAWYSARAGASRLLSETAPRLSFTEYESQALPIADEALRLDPSDPEAHYARAAALAQGGDYAAAVAELERVAALRPRYYQSWLKLGRARERAGDAGRALDDYRESVRLAPLYAEPRWQLGNTLLREGNLGEAFAELRRAAARRPQLLPYTLELAWHVYGGDAGEVERAVAPQTDAARIALARFFAKRGLAEEALALWHAARAGDEERRALVADLIAAGKFKEARAVWAEGAEGKDARGVDAAALTDGGFESKEGGDEQGFGWRFAARQAGAAVSLDQSSPHGGARSLLLTFDGSPDINTRFASQLAPAESGARYRLTFAARAENLVSGATPVVSVFDAAGSRVLAQSAPLPRDTGGWREYELEFTASDDAFLVVIRRAGCDAPACPVFGRAWFDDFSLARLALK